MQNGLIATCSQWVNIFIVPLILMIGGGGGATADGDICPQCGVDHKVERELLRRSRKRRRIIIVVAIVALIAILIARPIIAQLSLTPAQRMLVSADDMGVGWESTDPERQRLSLPGATDSAWARLGYEVGQTYVECSCHLTLFSTIEYANATYQKGLNNIEIFYRTNSVNISAGDRAAGIQSIHDGQVRLQAVMMQKGNAVVSITLQVLDGNGSIDPATVLKLVEAQASKLP